MLDRFRRWFPDSDQTVGSHIFAYSALLSFAVLLVLSCQYSLLPIKLIISKNAPGRDHILSNFCYVVGDLLRSYESVALGEAVVAVLWLSVIGNSRMDRFFDLAVAQRSITKFLVGIEAKL